MKGFGRLRDRGLIRLQVRRSCFGSLFLMAAAVAQVAKAFHVASGKPSRPSQRGGRDGYG